MELYSETLDPGETKDYAWDWSPKLAAGEIITGQTVNWIDRAGTTSPSDTHDNTVSRVFLTGGNSGARAIYVITAGTNQSRIFDVALAVDVVENSTSGAGDTEVERVTAELVAARATRAKVAAGEAIIELWRDGRRVRKQVPTLAELNAHIRALEQELEGASAVADGRPRRRAISLGYRN